jgi:hypothetical protein
MAVAIFGSYTVQCAGEVDGVRCPVMLDSDSSDAVRFCMAPECRKSYEKHYARRPEAKRKNLRRVHRRRYGKDHVCLACS